MRKKKSILVNLLIIMIFLISMFPIVKTEIIFSYDGPDVSIDLLELSDFTVEGPNDIKLFDVLRIKFSLRNVGNLPINFTDLGIFSAIRIRFYENRDFGFSNEDEILSPGEIVYFDNNITIDLDGYWQIWPSYEYWKPVWNSSLGDYDYIKTIGPEHWHECQLVICPDHCVDGIRYYDGYINQDGTCSYLEEECTYGCDEEGIDCGNVTRINITDGPNVRIFEFRCLPAASINWRTNIYGNSSVFYRRFGILEWESMVNDFNSTSHGFSLYDLEPNTTYYYYVKSCGPYDCIESDLSEFTTSNMLNIVDVQIIDTDLRSATISWKTHCFDESESAISGNRVNTNYSLYVVSSNFAHLPFPPWTIIRNDSFAFEHTIRLTGVLDEGKNYTFYIKSYTEEGVTTESERYTFETKEREFPQIYDITITPYHHSVDISWNTFRYVNTTIYLYNSDLYSGFDSWIQKESDETFTSSHSFSFTGLDDGISYFFIIKHCTSLLCNKTVEYPFSSLGCNDGIFDDGEIDIDCGGPCPPCPEIVFTPTWIPTNITPVHIMGIPEEKIDVVFIASETAWDRPHSVKVSSDVYTRDESIFESVVDNMVKKWYLRLDQLATDPIPTDYRERFNFYYYWDTSNFGDAFVGCSGELPDGFWNFAPFTDVAGILYPPYYVSGVTEAGGCANGLGPRSHFKGPGFYGIVTIHESGHAIFGLVDEYCGETYYGQNDPYPNVWSSETNCRDDVITEGWDPDDCRQIIRDDTSTMEIDCSRDYWRWNPDPEIMNVADGFFGPACVRHMNYMFEHVLGG